LRVFPAALHACLLLFPAAGARAGGADQEYFCADAEKPFFSAGPSGLVMPARARSCARPFSAAKMPGAARVFVVGESAATVLRDGPAPGRPEVVNCGMPGYDSARISRVLSEVLSYKPDLVVLLSGNNESGLEPCPGPAAELRRRYRRLLERFYSAFGRGLPAPVKASLVLHEGRVAAMAGAARRAGVPLVICTLPSNLLMPPAGQLPLYKPGFAAGVAAFERKAYGQAADIFLKQAPADPFAAYYAGRALYAAGRREEAARYLALAEDLSLTQERAGPARNAMLARVARKEGACLADFDAAFRKAAGGVTGFDQFDDGVHWRPAYNGLAWSTILTAASACGFGRAAAVAKAVPGEEAGRLAGKAVSYAASWLATEGPNERSVAELEYLLARDPAALGRASGSARGLASLFEENVWSAERASGLDKVYPLFAAAAAEAYRRAGRYSQALPLCEKALAALPGDARLLLLKGRILYGLGRPAEAAAAFYAPAAAGNSRAAEAVAEALGLKPIQPCSRRPALSRVPGAKKLSDEAAALFSSGDLRGAEARLAAALALEPDNPEALSTLCAARVKLGEAGAASACLAAAAAAEGCSGPGPGRQAMAAAAYLGAAAAERAAGLKKEAARDLKAALRTAPPGWPQAAEAETALKDLKD
jgi:tetratricopeptide (TPR) repeat protein